MAEQTAIGWATSTFNPWIGCAKVSEGCRHCYAEALMDHRYGRVSWGQPAPRLRTSEANWRTPRAWDRKAAASGEPWRVFCGSLCDVFEDHPTIESGWRGELLRLIEETPRLTWMLLTKRPENVSPFTVRWNDARPENVWLGVSVEDHGAAVERIPPLIEADAQVRFVSCEPLLGRVDLTYWLRAGCLQWVIAGAESGPGARPAKLAWFRALRDQCLAAGVPFFVKQFVDDRGRKIPEPELDGRRWTEFPGERVKSCRG